MAATSTGPCSANSRKTQYPSLSRFSQRIVSQICPAAIKIRHHAGSYPLCNLVRAPSYLATTSTGQSLLGGGKDRTTRPATHDLRHTLGTWLAQPGQNLVVIKEVLGHQDIRTTSALPASRHQFDEGRFEGREAALRAGRRYRHEGCLTRWTLYPSPSPKPFTVDQSVFDSRA